MKFTYKGTKCEVLLEDGCSMWDVYIDKHGLNRRYKSERRAIICTKRFIDKIIANAEKARGDA